MLPITKERLAPLSVGVLGVAAALFLLDTRVSAWLRVLPWLLVFGYPLGRMLRGMRERRS